MSERYTLYGHDGRGNIKSKQEVTLPLAGKGKSWERSMAENKVMSDSALFYTFVKDGKAEFSAGPVGWRSKFGERIPEYNGK